MKLKNDLLSIREIEIIKLICDGNTDGNIAILLSISPNTVRTHRKTILKKLKMNKTVMLVRYAIDQKII